MGQAVVDLPESSQPAADLADLPEADLTAGGPLSPEALANADDLLAQLAGDDIDRLLAEADAKPAAPAVAEKQAVEAPVAQAAPPVVEAAPVAEVVVEKQPERVVEKVVTPVVIQAAVAPAAEAQPKPEIVTASVDAPVPFYIRILEWINSPLLMCSDELRSAMGKIALLTLFNSIAVLIYVAMFRKHPHH